MKLSKEAIDSEKIFGENVRKFRKALKLSAEEFTAFLKKRGFEIGLNSVYRIEEGKKRILLRECVAIANAMGLSLDILLTSVNNMEEK